MRRCRRACLITVLALAPPAFADGQNGEAIFRNGEGISAQIAGTSVKLPGRAAICAGCHGADARGPIGVAEGGQAAPAINGATLSQPNRQRPAYDAESFKLAITTGIASNGRPLAAEMPRFAMSEAAASDLFAFMTLLDQRETQGLASDRLHISPPSDPVARAVVVAVVEEFNTKGGAWGREIVMGNPGFLDLPEALGILEDRLKVTGQARLEIMASEDPNAVVLTTAPSPPYPNGKHLIAQAETLGPLAETLVKNGNRLTLLAPSRAAMSWAKVNELDADAAELRMLTEGALGILLDLGRNPTRTRLRIAFERANPADWLESYDF